MHLYHFVIAKALCDSLKDFISLQMQIWLMNFFSFFSLCYYFCICFGVCIFSCVIVHFMSAICLNTYILQCIYVIVLNLLMLEDNMI